MSAAIQRFKLYIFSVIGKTQQGPPEESHGRCMNKHRHGHIEVAALYSVIQRQAHRYSVKVEEKLLTDKYSMTNLKRTFKQERVR